MLELTGNETVGVINCKIKAMVPIYKTNRIRSDMWFVAYNER